MYTDVYGADKFDVSYTTLKETVEKTSLQLILIL